jgi:hypothetical protein
LSLFRLENRVYLSRGVLVVGVAWRAAMRIMAGVGDLVQRTEDGRTGRVLGGRAIKRSSDGMCGPHHARGDDEHGFLGQASIPRSTVCQWFGRKITRMVSHRFVPQNQWRRFVSGLASKPLRQFSSVWPQNQ